MSKASSFERLMLALINEERETRGIDPLTLELRLNEASEDHSVWMDDTLNFSHSGVGGSNPGDRMRDAGFEFSGNWAWGENIAYQSERGAPGIADDVADLHQSLMNSPGHRANILNPNFQVIGIGIEEGDNRGFDAVYVTQNFARTSAPVELDLPNTGGGGDRIIGTSGDDMLTGNGAENRIFGAAGDDDLKGHGGNDTLSGGKDDDRLHAGQGDDIANGNAGNDKVFGGSGNDKVFGGDGRDDLNGGAGRDTLSGGTGNDILNASADDDRLVGGAGNDQLNGNAGNDRMTGNAGADLFIFSSGRDIITDFDTSQAGERIDLRKVSSITDFDDLMNGGHLRTAGQNIVIDNLNGSTLVLNGVTENELQANDFLF